MSFINASRDSWKSVRKSVLDYWLTRDSIGRGAFIGNIHPKELIKSHTGFHSGLPKFFEQALYSLRELTLVPMVSGRVSCKEEAEPRLRQFDSSIRQ